MIEIIDILKPKNGGSFKLIDAIDVAIEGYTSLADCVSHMATTAMIEAINAVLSGKQDKLTTAQLTAVNSGITAQLVTQIGTNTTAIAGKASQADLTALQATVNDKANSSDITNLQAQIDNIVTPVTQDAEVQNARVGADSTSYASLKLRLDAENNDLNAKTNELNGEVNLAAANNFTESTIFGWGEYAIGSLNQTVLNPVNKYRVSSTTLMHVEEKTVISIANGYKIGLSYTDSSGTFISFSDWKKSIYIIPAGSYFKVQIAKDPEDTSYIATVAEFTSKIKVFKSAYRYSKSAIANQTISSYGVNVVNLSDYNLIYGTLSTGVFSESSIKRIATEQFIRIKDAKSLSVVVNEGYKFGYAFYRTPSENTFISGATQFITTDTEFVIPNQASYIRFNLALVTDGDMDTERDSNGITVSLDYGSRSDSAGAYSYYYTGKKMPSKKYGYNSTLFTTIADLPYSQDSEIYNDYFFTGILPSGIRVYSLTTKQFITSLSVETHHGSGMQFSNEFYSNGDTFPLLYVGGWSDNLISVVHITLNNGNFNAEVVRTLKIPTTYGYYASPSIDTETNTLYVYAHTSDPIQTDKMIISRFDLDTLADNGDNTFTPAFIDQHYSVYLGSYQGHKFFNGSLYIGNTVGNRQKIIAIDAGTGDVETVIDVTPIDNKEIEGLCYRIVDNNIKWYFNCANDALTNLYELTFE